MTDTKVLAFELPKTRKEFIIRMLIRDGLPHLMHRFQEQISEYSRAWDFISAECEKHK